MANSQGPSSGRPDSGVHFHCTGCTFYLNTAGTSHGQEQHQPQQGLNTQSAPAQPAPHTNLSQQHNTHAPANPFNAAPQPWDQQWQNLFPEPESQQPPFAPITDEEFNTWLQSLPNFDIACANPSNQAISQSQTLPITALSVGAHHGAPLQQLSSYVNGPVSHDLGLERADSALGENVQESPKTSSEDECHEEEGEDAIHEQGSSNGTAKSAAPALASINARKHKILSSRSKASAQGKESTKKKMKDELKSENDEEQATAGAEHASPSTGAWQWQAPNWDDLMGGPYDGTLLP